MGTVLEFKRKKIAFIGEMIHVDGDVIHTPYLYKIADPVKGEELCTRLFTIDDLDELPCDDWKINNALGEIYEWCYEYFNSMIEYEADSFKLYAVSLEDRRIMYSLILMNGSWVAGDWMLDHCLPQYFSDEKGLPTEPADTRGNTICMVGEVLDASGEVYHTPVVTKITNVKTGRVQFPGLFRRRSLKSFFDYDKYQDVISCLFHCLICEAEKMGADTWLVRDDNEFQNIGLAFVDRRIGRVLYELNTIQSTVDGNIVIPEDWTAEGTCPRYIDLSDAQTIELNVEFEAEED